MAGRSVNSLGSANKDWSPGPPSTRYNVSGKSREYYTFENAPGTGAYASGGSIIDGGDGYIYHVFLGNGTFSVSRPPAVIDSVEYLIVAGGGGSGGAGGGGGGLRTGAISVTQTSYPIVVGAGGGATPGSPPYLPATGNNSSGFGIVSNGGGFGGSPIGPAPGGAGGSGGGAYTGSPGINDGVAGSGNSPPTITRQGYPGGSAGATFVGGGGGGAGGPGGPSLTGGPGKIISAFPSSIISKAIPSSSRSSWQSSISANGFSKGAPHSAGIGTVNSGYGGGFSGIVCIRYKKTSPYTRATGGIVEPSTDPNHRGVWRHIFTSPGTFTVTDPSLTFIDYLAVGGGGGGGYGYGGGGGAGGFVTSIETSTTTPTSIPEAYSWAPGVSVRVGKQYPVISTSYPITVGAGGTGGSGSNPSPGSDGTNSTIGSPGPSQIIAYGGGGGGSGNPASTPFAGVSNGRSGGSGGGGARSTPTGSSPPYGIGGAASPTPLIQGNQGYTQIFLGSGGMAGGGASAGGAPNSGSITGGAGWYSVISPPSYGTPGPLVGYRYFAGGGGGGAGVTPAPTTPGPASNGGGAGGPTSAPTNGTPGTTNTGGGGGGGSASGNGGNGGPGIVIIQYPE